MYLSQQSIKLLLQNKSVWEKYHCKTNRVFEVKNEKNKIVIELKKNNTNQDQHFDVKNDSIQSGKCFVCILYE